MSSAEAGSGGGGHDNGSGASATDEQQHSPSSLHPAQSPLSPNTEMTASLLKVDTTTNGDATGSAAAGGAPPVSPLPAAAGSAEKAAKRAATCDKVLAEIVSTERLYLSNLQQVVSVYLKPLQAAHTQADLGLKPAHLQAIFANLEGIGQSHAQGKAGTGNTVRISAVRRPGRCSQRLLCLHQLLFDQNGVLRIPVAARSLASDLTDPCAVCVSVSAF